MSTPVKRETTRRPDARPGEPVTEREQQVLERMSQGLTNKRIGARMGLLSEQTVKTHARRLFRKISARNRAHAVRRGYELGLLTTAQRQPAAELTDLELRILQLISEGMSNGRIGARLVMSEHMVKSHNRVLFGMLRARDRAHAVRQGFDCGLLWFGSAGRDQR